MLRCTIELIPGGDEKHPRRSVIGVVEIGNVSGSSTRGDYIVVLKKSAPFSISNGHWRKAFMDKAADDDEIMAGEVKGFERRRLGPYDLMFRALKACIGARNK